MKGKTVQSSTIVTSQIMGIPDVNVAGNIHGGAIMKLIDTAAGAVAFRHARSNAVTASIDRLDFHFPVYPGDLVTCKASLNYIGKTSMEIGVRVEAENLIKGDVRHTASAYLTFVALDEASKPLLLPPLILKTKVEKRRNQEAKIRREARLREKKPKNQ
jgi:acyl-CoA hydrolase